jgi:hypothetical protein
VGTINQIKQAAQTDTPILFFECVLPSGDAQYWSTHRVSFSGNAYVSRVLKHNLFELQLSSDEAMDGISQLSLTLANADSALSELNAAVGFKGSQLTVWFAFCDLASGGITTESLVLFRGTAGAPDLITEDSITLSFTNKLSLQRIPIPDVRIQRTCAWTFPANTAQRTEAIDGGTKGRFSRFFRCGYSADLAGGIGNLSANGTPYTSCDKSRSQCSQRGMFNVDSRNNATRRFGGFEFVPSAINVRTAGDKTSHLSPILDNSAKFNDPVPLVYGTGWIKAPIIFARNDGNLTHVEVLLALGSVQGVLKTVVNDVEIPLKVAGTDMATTGWYMPVTTGDRQGSFDLDFVDSANQPLGDPYGSMAVLSVVVPNRICSGKSLPNVEILLQGQQIDTFGSDGGFLATEFTNNPAWVILDILKRSGWSAAELNISSFWQSAMFCAELIATTDLNGNALRLPRYQSNLVLNKRQSTAAVIRGVRVASSLMLRYGLTGLLELVPETTIALQQSMLPDGSNSVLPLNGGWPSYEFSDGSANFSGIGRNSNGTSSVRMSSRSVAETSNRLSVEFQDATNEYQQDSLSLIDADDVGLIGYEVSAQSTALGVSNFNQATRVLLRQLDKSTKGNLFIEFVTSFRALKVRTGDIITVTYLKEGLSRTAFRVIKLAPGMNYETVSILAQIHDDDWYSDNPAVLMNAGRQPGSVVQTPRPLLGVVPHNDISGNFEYFDFSISEKMQARKDGSATDTLSVSFTQPNSPSKKLTNVPLVGLNAHVSTSGGTIKAGLNLYYSVTAVDADGLEGSPSFTIPVSIPAVSNSNQITIIDLSFPQGTTGFHVYRGSTPQGSYRITSVPQPISDHFTDTGLLPTNYGPPDLSFDHANFYYRNEYAGPFIADSFSATAIGCSDMGAQGINYGSRIARIVEGSGRGQERLISSNTATVLTLSSAWSTLPDATSQFVVVDSSWKFAAVTSSSPATFEIPFVNGETIHISGRAANVHNQECSVELSPITRWTLGSGQPDGGLSEAPNFVLSAPGGGNLTLSQVNFPSLANTSSITSGTLELFAINELQTSGTFTLKTAMALTDSQLAIAEAPLLSSGDVLQVGTELVAVLSATGAADTYSVARGAILSQKGIHQAGDSVVLLSRSSVIVPFASGYFEGRASQNFTHTISYPDYRVCAAQFHVTNSFGDSPSNQYSYLSGDGSGLRTLSGGQFNLQVSGFVTSETNAAPPVVVEASHAVRDIRATLTQPSAGYDLLITVIENGNEYCNLTIHSGQKTSSIINGLSLAPLQEGSSITMNIAANPTSGFSGIASPGMDLTLTIRL